MGFNKEMRAVIIEQTKGKVVESLEYVDDYWVMNFTDGTEASFRFMAELNQGEGYE